MAAKSINLRLEQLPDRTPVKLRIAVPPDLHRDLSEYAAAYEARYAVAETVAALIPSMLEAFITSDAGFKRFQKRAAHEGVSVDHKDNQVGSDASTLQAK